MRVRSRIPAKRSTRIEGGEQFIRSQFALWSARILSRYPLLDRETLEFVAWVFDPGSGTLAGALTNAGLPAGTDALATCSRPEEQALTLTSQLLQWDSGQQARAAQVITDALSGLGVPGSGDPMAKSLSRVADTYGLSKDDCAVALLLANMSSWTYAERYFDTHLECDRASGRRYLLAALDMTPARMSAVLEGKLPRIGILEMNKTWLSINSSFMPLFLDPSEAATLDHLHRPVPAPDVALQQLDVPESSLRVIRTLLTTTSSRPVHILVYGPPGVGKTSLARCLVHSLGLDGLEVMGRREGSSTSRRSAIEACWNMSSGVDNRVLVVDEADHLIATGRSWIARGETTDKAWLNEVLERPGIRCIWIANHSDDIEPAVRRRFDFSLHTPVPGVRTRKHVLERIIRHNRIKRHFTDEQMAGLARDYPTSPAVYASAASTAALSCNTGARCRETFQHALDAAEHLATGEPRRKMARGVDLIREGINSEPSLDNLEAILEAHDARARAESGTCDVPPFNMLFHGVPGTGKTLTARFLASHVDRPVHLKKASDLLDPYVGGTERRIAEAFEIARREGAVLVIDEIDSLLNTRADAVRTWEVTQVNEMLTQMEEPGTVLIATTNRREDIDTAAMRRFSVCVEFRPLAKQQRVVVYRAVFRGLRRGAISKTTKSALEGLAHVTTADMSRVRQMLALRGYDGIDDDAILKELTRTSGLVHSRRQPIGFTMCESASTVPQPRRTP